ncbi:superinfection immunity protein [Allopusillimonas ginsengisoli]|uniref:superinfection immunity protein n=1 Tax=Allopusillimonas ginsengisoli TaxID=453575 RepID=UPI00102273A8|nr:superinfection immunity protein [Allopusillimonas ginsengisoli]TEA79811.1 superinfection immunity protein [Allopusillimonas ginsengisoli]
MVFLRIFALAALVLFSFAVGSGTNQIAAIMTPVFFISAIALYFLPTIEGNLRKQANINSIALVNIFLGWTLVGWVVAIAWACKEKHAVEAPRAEEVTSPPRSPNAQTYTSTSSVADQLTKLATLKEKGILTDEEFASQKAKLLA